MSFLHRPHSVRMRKAMFQIHLWIGIALCLYMCLIGITGSILVFQDEIEGALYSSILSTPEGKLPARVSVSEALGAVHSVYPDAKPFAVYFPVRLGTNYAVYAYRGSSFRRIYVSPVSGRVAGEINPNHTWLALVTDLHFRLHAGRVGSILNGLGAICLLLLCLTGSIIWWSGIASWTRGLKVRLTRNWKRLNLDLHRAVGFWTLSILCVWAISSIYFVWQQPVEKAVSRYWSLGSLHPPQFILAPHETKSRLLIDRFVRQAGIDDPGTRPAGVFLPTDNKDALTILMARSVLRDLTKVDYIYFDPVTGQKLGVWRSGRNLTIAGHLLFLLAPLHYGIYWGLAIKILWATLGTILPLLALTGVLMYWNRSLGKKWKRLKRMSDRRYSRGERTSSKVPTDMAQYTTTVLFEPKRWE